VFGNKGYGWKLAAGLALIAVLGVDCAVRGDWINPSIWRCVAWPSRTDGDRIWVPLARVVEVRERDYDVDSSGVRIRVSGPAPAAVESRIALIAVFHAEGPRLEPLKTRLLSPGDGSRWAMEIVSVLVTLGVLANFARYFLFRPAPLQVERETR
jgi:hypothetical protein